MMRFFYLINFFFCFIVTLSFGQNNIKLPIEVLGAEGNVEIRQFYLDDPDKGYGLWLQANNLSYEGKGSVRVNGSEWIALTNANILCKEPDKSYGGIGGGYSTIRFVLPIPKGTLRAGENNVYFKFNYSDGISVGYRVINLNIVDKGGKKLLPEDAFTEQNPSEWTPFSNNSAYIAEGKQLWYTAQLKSNYLAESSMIQATCSACHAEDGRDLKYFNYSNKSIVERAKFHGLSEQEGKKIASYIRTLNVPAPRQARPWNPPYQPGPGTDQKPVEEWAAGAGLEWVLNNDKKMLPYLFPHGTSQEAINKVIDTKKTRNMRALPIALQLPDWKHWLPIIHPVDIWGSNFLNDESHKIYLETRNRLEQEGVQALIDSKELLTVMNRLREETDKFIGVMRGGTPCLNGNKSNSEALSKLPAKYDCEDALRALNHWSAVKRWEIMQEFSLEDKAPQLYLYGERRSWIGKWREVFELAPHRSANNSVSYENQSQTVAAYFNTAWYQLQMILNAGNRNPNGNFPLDWKYQLQQIEKTVEQTGQPQALRLTASFLKMYQNLDRLDSDKGPMPHGWWMQNVHPRRFENIMHDVNGKAWAHLETYQPGLRKKVAEAFLKAFLDKTLSYDMDEWTREPTLKPSLKWVEHPNYKPTPYTGKSPYYYTYPYGQADAFYRVIPRLRAVGVSENLLNTLIDWCATMWPLGDWYALRAEDTKYPFQLEIGNATVEQATPHQWHTVQLKKTFQNPIVIMGPVSFNGKEAATTRVRNITGSSFQFKIDEWENLNGIHKGETISYMVMEKGAHFLNGKMWEAGSLSNLKHEWQVPIITGTFVHENDYSPIVLVQAVTNNNNKTLVVRLDEVKNHSFKVKLQNLNKENLSKGETLHYIVIPRGMGEVEGHKYLTTGAKEVETDFGKELFPESFSRPAFFASTRSYYGKDPVAIRYQSLSEDEVFLKIEDPTKSPAHIPEHLFYMVIETPWENSAVARMATKEEVKLKPEDSLMAAHKMQEIGVYPNPANDYLKIFYRGTSGSDMQWQLLNAQGQVVKQGQASAGTNELHINVSDLIEGIYILTMQSKETTKIEKVIIQR